MRAWIAVCFLTLGLLTVAQMRASSAARLEQHGEYARALASNPRLGSAWIALGLAAEHDRRFEAARAELLEAARVDHRYLPAWTLANFFFRRNDVPDFWLWARRAAALTYDDPRPLLRLAHSLERDEVTLLDALGAGDKFIRADLDSLVASRQWTAAQQSARVLLNRNEPADRDRLLEAADRQVGAGNAAYALELWRALYPWPPVTREILFDAGFDQTPSNLAFDWRLPQTAGITAEWRPHLLSFAFDGSQGEEQLLLEQVLARPAPRYRLRYEARTTGLASPSGLHWAIGRSESPAIPSGPDWRSLSASFAAPPTPLLHLRLIYRREPGTVRAPGLLQIRSLSLEALP